MSNMTTEIMPDPNEVKPDALLIFGKDIHKIAETALVGIALVAGVVAFMIIAALLR